MQKLIFLDFDGVLNSNDWYTKNKTKGDFDPKAIERLNYIVEQTNAKIVLSTSWRFDPNIYDKCKEIGIKGEVIGRTPSLRYFASTNNHSSSFICRGNEIAAWLTEFIEKNQLHSCHWQYDSYVIIDDDCDMLLSQKDNFVHVDYFKGLTKKDAEKAIKILNRKQ